jgi:drug/metabolite transporter (DMT)-like permease
VLPVAIGLGAAACIGVADYLAGISSRRFAPLQVGFWVQLLALGVVAVTLLATRPPFALSPALWGLAAGIGSGIGLTLLYRALAAGAMSLVAPIVGCSVVLPVVFSVLRGETLTPLAGGGVTVVFAGILLASLQPASHPGGAAAARLGGERHAVLCAVGSALGFGLFLVLIDVGAAASAADSLWTTGASRVTAFGVQALLILLGARVVAHPGPVLPALAAIAVLDQMATMLLGFGAVTEAYGIVSILFGLYPVVTALLGALLLGERLTRLQGTGAILAVVGVMLVSV